MSRHSDLMNTILDIAGAGHCHVCCKCQTIEQCELGKFCDGPGNNDYCVPCAQEKITAAVPCPRCGAQEGYAVSRTVEVGGELDERRDQIMMRCNVCDAPFEVEDIEPRILN